MKKFIILSLMLLLSVAASATKYHIAASGSSGNNGLSPLTPFTAAKCNTITFSPDDTIAIKAGDVVLGQLIINQSGTAGHPIVVTSYGTGDLPVLTGFVTVSSWTSLGANIYESNAAVSSLSSLNMLTVSGVNTAMGRYPNQGAANGGYLTFQSHTSNTSITSSSLTGTPNWTGAEVVVRPVRWILDRRTITSQSGGTLNFAALSYVPIDGFGFFIQNDERTLDAQNEWYYNPSTKKLKIYSTGLPSDVKVATVEDLLTLNGSYITVDGISIQGSNDNLITGASTLRMGITVKNCLLKYSGGTVLNGINCENFLIDNNTVSEGNNNGVSGGTADNVVISNNTFQNIGLLHGMGSLIYSAISTGENANVKITYNKIFNVGYVAISFYGDNTAVKYNLIDGFCSVLDDGGGIYTYTGNRAAMVNDTIKGNIVLNGIGAIAGTSGNQTSTAIGIYLDNNTKNVSVTDNYVANCNTYGMLMNNPSYIDIQRNTFYNNSPQIRSSFIAGSNQVTNMNISNNKFIAKTATQGMIYLVSGEENLANFGTIDNNYYARPLDNTGAMFLTSQPSALYQNRTFASWKSYLSKDANSSLSSKVLASEADISAAYNATKTAAPVALSFAGIDAAGIRHPSTVTLQPFNSIVLLKDIVTSVTLKATGLKDAGGNPIGVPQ